MQLDLFTFKEKKKIGEHRICSKCNKEKHISKYAFQMGGKSLRTECKKCSSAKNDLRTQLKRENPRPIDPAYCCPICNKTEKELKSHDQFPDRSIWALDHNHIDHPFRAWICNNCNTGLGRFKDNVNIIKRALEYLEQNETTTRS